MNHETSRQHRRRTCSCHLVAEADRQRAARCGRRSWLGAAPAGGVGLSPWVMGLQKAIRDSETRKGLHRSKV